MSTLSETVLDQIEIKGKTIGILRLEERNPQKVLEELARMNTRPATREEALEYRKKKADFFGSEAESRKFEGDPEGKTNEPIVFALRKDCYILGYLSDVGGDIFEANYQGIVVAMTDSVIYRKEKTTVSYKVAVPKKHAGNFIVSFGDTFSETGIGHSYPIAQVDKYERLRPNVESSWCTYVTVPEEKEEELKNFIKNFSKENNLGFSTF